ncbi:MAG: NYN domain-containing protein [Pirellulales bacterium]
MAILIDGYNLLHVTGIFGRGIGPGGLERSRRALLNFLAESIDPNELPRTTVVFDAVDAPRGLPREVKHGDMTVHYATGYDSADALIEQLVAKSSTPRRLTVVSSDHRLQRAARRRRATAIDSDVWYGALVERRRERNLPSPAAAAKPEVPLSPDQVEYWLSAFGGEAILDEAIADGAIADGAMRSSETVRHAERQSDPGDGDSSDGNSDDGDSPESPQRDAPVFNPFPPGYGEDIERQDLDRE